MSYIGNVPFTKASYNNVEVLATEGQTTFNVSYSPNFVDVLVNGVELSKTDYVAVNGASIVLNEPLALNDVVVFKVWGTFQVADAVATGGGSQTVLGEKTFEDFRLLEDVNGDKLIKDSSGLTLATFDSEGKLNANNGLSYVGGAVLVDSLSAVFTNSTNNIYALGSGIGNKVEKGDVIQIIDSANNSGEFTVEVITDADNVIVNQAHAGKSRTVAPIGTKALIDETATVTIKLLCKWYLAPVGLGQGWVDVTANRARNVDYIPTANRSIKVAVGITSNSTTDEIALQADGIEIGRHVYSGGAISGGTATGTVPVSANTYRLSSGAGASSYKWAELR